MIDVRIDNKASDVLYIPLENTDSDVVGYKLFSNVGKLNKIMPSETAGGIIIGKSSTRCKDQAVVVPNFSDFLILLDSTVSGTVVCLPNGLTNLSQYILPSLEKYNKLVLWFGNDVHSWDSARCFAKKLGEKRCFIIRYVN